MAEVEQKDMLPRLTNSLVLLHGLLLQRFLSFGVSAVGIPLGPLNLLIGPNLSADAPHFECKTVFLMFHMPKPSASP